MCNCLVFFMVEGSDEVVMNNVFYVYYGFNGIFDEFFLG